MRNRSEDKSNTIEQVTQRVEGLTAKKIRGLVDAKSDAQKKAWASEALENHAAGSETFEDRMMKRRQKAETEPALS